MPVQTITADMNPYVKPVDLDGSADIIIDCIGPGGDGDGGNLDFGLAGGGGGAFARIILEGGFVDGVVYAASLDSSGSYFSTVGEEGANICVAAGGQAGEDRRGGAGGADSDSTGDFKQSGGSGGNGVADVAGGGGGGAASLDLPGESGGDGGSGDGGAGGASLDNGAGGAGGASGAAGTAGQNYGGGGGGAGAGFGGGSGAPGVIYVRYTALGLGIDAVVPVAAQEHPFHFFNDRREPR